MKLLAAAAMKLSEASVIVKGDVATSASSLGKLVLQYSHWNATC